MTLGKKSKNKYRKRAGKGANQTQKNTTKKTKKKTTEGRNPDNCFVLIIRLDEESMQVDL